MGMCSTIYSNDLSVPSIKNPIKVDEEDSDYLAFRYVTDLLEMDVVIDETKELGKEPVQYVVGVDNYTNETYNETKMYYFAESFPIFVKMMYAAAEEPVTGSFIVVDENFRHTEYEAKPDGTCFAYDLEMKPSRKKTTALN